MTLFFTLCALYLCVCVYGGVLFDRQREQVMRLESEAEHLKRENNRLAKGIQTVTWDPEEDRFVMEVVE